MKFSELFQDLKHKHRAKIVRFVTQVDSSGKTDYVRIDLKCGAKNDYMYVVVKRTHHLAQLNVGEEITIGHG